MIITEISKKKIVSTVVLILLFFITLTRIDYTGLQTFSLKMAIDVLLDWGIQIGPLSTMGVGKI